MKEIEEMVGVEAFKEHVRELNEHSKAYGIGKAKLKHLLLNISEGNGQTYMTEKFCDFLQVNNLREFDGREDYLEYRVSENCDNLQTIFEDIYNNSCYSNEFKGVISIDITSLSKYVDKPQMKSFINNIVEVSKYSTLLFFYDEKENNIEKVKLKIKETLKRGSTNGSLEGVKDIYIEPYTAKDYCEIILLDIDDRGIKFNESEALKKTICMVIKKENVDSVLAALDLADEIMFCVDYSDVIPRLVETDIKEHFGIKTKRKE